MNWTERLASTVADTDRVLVVAGYSYDPAHRDANDVLAETRDPPSVAQLIGSLRVSETDHAAMEWPSISIVLLAGRKSLATVGCILPWLRCDVWPFDAKLADDEPLRRWLASVGLSDQPGPGPHGLG